MSTLYAASEISAKPTTKPSTLFKRTSFAETGTLNTIPEFVTETIFKKIYVSKMVVNASDDDLCCSCNKNVHKGKQGNQSSVNINALLETKLIEKEVQLRQEFQKENDFLKQRFDLILQNEQARTACMLREARRERKEKISALQQQLECKNMAGLMYVMCAERTKCKVEKMKIIEIYTNYINMLNDILADGQNLILNLSRGFKTAARVDHEWKQKMKRIIEEFQAFICNFTGSSPEQNQYLFNFPKLLHCDAPKEDNPDEDPIEEEQEEEQEPEYEEETVEEDEQWWQQQDQECRPFAVFGDMSGFNPPQRREALKKIKAAKTAPKRWKHYVFHDMFLNSKCPNMEVMKNEYFHRIPDPSHNWKDCLVLTRTNSATEVQLNPRQNAAHSVDIRGNMGSILKIVTTTGATDPMTATKTNLLGARDSMEIVSTTKVRERSKSQDLGASNVEEIKVGTRRTSFFDDAMRMSCVQESMEEGVQLVEKMSNIDAEPDAQSTNLAKEHTNSLNVIPLHVPERDHVINYEKKCPMEECQRKHVDSFLNSLPKYMRASPFTHFEETFETYETCTPEQLGILKNRLDEKKKKEKKEKDTSFEDPLEEWKDEVLGVGVQTSNLSYLDDNLPPCTCRDSNESTITGPGAVYRMEDLIPVKQNIDQITKECLWNDQIQFERFKVIGEDQTNSERAQTLQELQTIKKNFTQNRLQEIQKILKQHPSLLELFQANTRC